MTAPRTVDEYVTAFPPEVAERLTALRRVINAHLPGGSEVIRYGMPAVMLESRYGLHFAGWKKHVALYPVPRFEPELEAAIAPYRSHKDTVAFQHHQELPVELVGRICDAVVEQRRADPPT